MKGAPTPVQTDFFKWRFNDDAGGYILTDEGAAIVWEIQGEQRCLLSSEPIGEAANFGTLARDISWDKVDGKVEQDGTSGPYPSESKFSYRGVQFTLQHPYDGADEDLQPAFADQIYQP